RSVASGWTGQACSPLRVNPADDWLSNFRHFSPRRRRTFLERVTRKQQEHFMSWPVRSVVALCLLLESAAFAEPPAVKVDRYGGPLPPGAIARLGTTRLRHPGMKSLTFFPDGKALASTAYGGTVRLWEVRTGKELLAFANQEASCVAFSPDGKG